MLPVQHGALLQRIDMFYHERNEICGRMQGDAPMTSRGQVGASVDVYTTCMRILQFPVSPLSTRGS
jgi:hypothetical protein